MFAERIERIKCGRPVAFCVEIKPPAGHRRVDVGTLRVLNFEADQVAVDDGELIAVPLVLNGIDLLRGVVGEWRSKPTLFSSVGKVVQAVWKGRFVVRGIGIEAT